MLSWRLISLSQQMDFSSGCVDYVDFRWPEGVEVFAAAHPLDEIPREQLSANPDVPIVSSVSNPAVAFPIPTAPGQLVLSLEFGRSYLYVTLFCISKSKFMHALLLKQFREVCQWIRNMSIHLTLVLLLKHQPPCATVMLLLGCKSYP